MPGFAYKSYSFLDKDPIIDLIRTLVQQSHYSLKKIAEDSGVNQNTISNWLYGKTKRPQAAGINAVLRTLDYKLDIVTINTTSIIIPTPYVPVPTNPGKAIDRSKPKKRMGASKYSRIGRGRHVVIKS
jgi:transcriptional regulator with XRE-family HTH domain